MHKRAQYVVRRVVGYTLLSVYLLIAALNSTVVQSYIGAVVGNYFSKEWGGKVRIGALHASPISHVILDDIELISPTNDTIYYGERITCRFKAVPFPWRRAEASTKYRSAMDATTSIHSATPRESRALIWTLSYTTLPSVPPLRKAQAVSSPWRWESCVCTISTTSKTCPNQPTAAPMPTAWTFRTCGSMTSRAISGISAWRTTTSMCASCRSPLPKPRGSTCGPLHGCRGVAPRHPRHQHGPQTDDSRVFMDARLDFDGWDEMGTIATPWCTTWC